MKRLIVTLAAAFVLLPGALFAQSTPSKLGVDTGNFDTSIRPQDDFYRYVNGTWLKDTEIPSDKSNYGAFTELADKSEADLRALIEDAAATPDKQEGSDVQKIGDFYTSFMDSASVEALGMKPVQPELDSIAALESKDDVIAFFGAARRHGFGGPFGLFVGQDAHDATRYVTQVSQGGLGLPDRDYYSDDRFQDVREAYKQYIARLFELAGRSDGAEAADEIMALETQIAQRHWTRVQSRDRNATYNAYDPEKAHALTPDLDWDAILTAAGIPAGSTFIVRQPSFFAGLDSIAVDTPVDVWKTYLTFKALDAAAPYLSSDFVDARFDFYGRQLSGIQELEPRWKRAVGTMNRGMGELIGKRYVALHFKPEAKARMTQLVQNLRSAFAQAIDENDWMDDATKAEAKTKLAKFNFKIGYPDKWRDYSALVIHPDDLFGNVQRAGEVAYQRMIDRLGEPVDRTEWGMTPQTVNAYYSPTMNEVVFPAAILQPPFFNMEADDAVNYGAIVAVIGHEFSHGFDDQGRKSDGDGNLREWWTDASGKEFEKRAKMLGDEYSAFNPIEDMHVNGQLTMGENIGDLSGLSMAYKAYKLSLDGKEAPVIDGFTGDQRFFLGWAQVWRRKYTDGELRRRLLTDPHSPSEYRTNGIVANLPAFYQAFDVKEGDGLYRKPDERVKIW